jgi:molybdate transport system substrate-binding protein
MSMLARSMVAGAVVAVVSAISACARAPAKERLVVFAAASMSAPMERIVAEFAGPDNEVDVQLHSAGTPYLLMQVREGAEADVFVAADEPSMAQLERHPGVLAPARVFAANTLAIAVAHGNPKGIGSLLELSRPDLLVALCGPDVPAGRYAREALRKAGVEVRSVSDEPNVKALLTKVRLGEVDAGILYRTDLIGPENRPEPGVDAVAIPPVHNVRAAYPVAILASTNRRPAAEAFVEFLFSPAARNVLESAGFTVP